MPARRIGRGRADAAVEEDEKGWLVRPDAARRRRKGSGVQWRAAAELASAATEEEDALLFFGSLERETRDKERKIKDKIKIKRRVWERYSPVPTRGNQSHAQTEYNCKLHWLCR